jgi:hypothetical protein
LTGASRKQTLQLIAGLQLGSTPLWRDAVEGSLRIAIFTQVRLLGEAIALSLAARDAHMEVVLARHLEELRGLTAEHPALELVIVDTTQSVDLEAIRAFHRDHPELPLLGSACASAKPRSSLTEVRVLRVICGAKTVSTGCAQSSRMP